MKTEYEPAVVIRHKDDYRIAQWCPSFAEIVDAMYEKIAGRIPIPLYVEVRIWADHCQNEPLIAVYIRHTALRWWAIAKFLPDANPQELIDFANTEIAKFG